MDPDYFIQELMEEEEEKEEAAAAAATNGEGACSIKIERIETVPDIHVDDAAAEHMAAEALSHMSRDYSTKVESSSDESDALEIDLKHRPRTISCPQCGIVFATQADVERHMAVHKLVLPHRCDTCGQQFSRASSLTNHRKIHTYIPGRALVAKYEVSDDDDDDDEMEVLPGPSSASFFKSEPSCSGACASSALEATENKHICEECGKSFPTKQKVERHSWTHREKPFHCEQCGAAFHTHEELKIHCETSHEKDSPFVCTICAKTFSSKQSQCEHERMCGNGSRFQCTACDKVCTTRQSYRIHLRSHTDERPYGCSFCKSAFRDGGTLMKHVRIHTGVRPHACPICPRAFAQKGTLRNHVPIHVRSVGADADGMLTCSLCDKKLPNGLELCAHLVHHSDLMKNAKTAETVAKIDLSDSDDSDE